MSSIKSLKEMLTQTLSISRYFSSPETYRLKFIHNNNLKSIKLNMLKLIFNADSRDYLLIDYL